jgi:hypothetical protein
MGFDFAVATEVEPMRGWAREVCGALGTQVEGLDEFSAAAQFARLEGDREVCFADIAAALPGLEEKLVDVAKGNDFEMTRAMPLGKAIMLSGPQWNGQLRLEGAQRLSFEAAVAERSAKARERGEAELRVAEAEAALLDAADAGAATEPAMEE